MIVKGWSNRKLSRNGFGEICGYYFDRSETQRGFSFKGESTSLRIVRRFDVPNSYDTEPRGINSKGVIVGDYFEEVRCQ
jgi:hypothetical protein